jgi:hypothetical protein
MNKLTIALLAMALSTPGWAFAQNTQNAGQENKQVQKHEDNEDAEVNMMGGSMQVPHHVTGMVSNNGKNLTVGNTTYVVGNASKLKKYDGKTVSVKYQANTNNTLHIMSVSPQQ